jgi:hypothetical protein
MVALPSGVSGREQHSGGFRDIEKLPNQTRAYLKDDFPAWERN